MTSYVLMPVDATRSMIDAAVEVEEDGYDAMHKAMIAARPAVPEEVVERVAAALYVQHTGLPVAFWAQVNDRARGQFMDQARAAIRALGGAT